VTRATASEQLSAWIDGELTDAEAAELEAELARDPSLRAELAELEAVVRTLHDEGPDHAPAGFRERVLARVEREHPRRAGLAAWMRRPFGVPLEGWTLAAAVAAVLILTVLPALRRAPEPVGGEPAAIEVRPFPQADGTSVPTVDGTAPPSATPATTPEQTANAKPVAPVQALELLGTAEVTQPSEGATMEIAGPALPQRSLVLDSYTGRQRIVARVTDPNMKQTVRAYLVRWGAATDVDGAEIQGGAMTSAREDLLVTIPQDELYAFTNGMQQLRRQGIDVQWDEGEGLVPGDAVVRVAVTLELVETP
jgi:negative regulator of sigma E activity